MTTETPKTDAATDALDVACYPVALYAVAGFADFVKFARKLETDRAVLIAALQRIISADDYAQNVDASEGAACLTDAIGDAAALILATVRS
jgi:hypothetical protein